ncbi:conserved hypothetical protein [Candidatus Ruthia magnifica str. Cm (Calyptogena magnifica)]|uniref:AlgX/AlgJ SGNH hydrolase-like domain-containing protein n=1 Tax=Ruthia magnifica subsp. Calyptogena magnifica TaxID=413404 RepID=A1AVG6_RUTMC|nr:hypothetical protein [Candidatus Ruthturnera calyptogenae]ABL01923.1 conserved hypothetical protein [Candidatus Ruthia magnifica str. Cm (Calyptogena magnifica)]
MKEKKYLYIFSLLIILLIGFHFITWNLITKEFFIHKENIDVGDLGRMSYLSKSLTLRKNKQNLPNKHIQYNDNVEIDILTIGDSFSYGKGGGNNKYYQDYIATTQNLKVMNIQPSGKGYIETILILSSNGILDKLNPKSIILQSVENGAVDRYAKIIDWDIGLKNISTSFLDKKYSHSKPNPSFINNLNYNALLYSLLYKYDDNAIFSKTYITPLIKNLFSCEDKDRLLFYYKDLESLSKSNNKSIDLLNKNLNKLQKILSEKNINLYFMPSVDKYNLYSKYIQHNKYQQSAFFEILRPLKKEYNFIDTKMILEEMLDNNISDVYYCDDTHWSFKASEEIFKQVRLK